LAKGRLLLLLSKGRLLLLLPNGRLLLLLLPKGRLLLLLVATKRRWGPRCCLRVESKLLRWLLLLRLRLLPAKVERGIDSTTGRLGRRLCGTAVEA